MVRGGTTVGPWLSFVGVLALLAGLSLDAVLHRLDPSLAAREGVFSLENPAHALFLLGIALTVAGMGVFLLGQLAAARGLRRLLVVPPLAALLVLSLAGLALARWSDSAHGSVGHHPHGSSDGHGHPAVVVTADELRAALKLVDETRQGAARFVDVAVAQAEGYRQVTPGLFGVAHYVNPAYLADGRTLDPQRPESLIYRQSPDGSKALVGVMYLMPPGVPGPRVGGDLTAWHTHDNLCFNGAGMVVGLSTGSRGCPPGSTNPGTTGEMLHVWLVDNPNGVFAEHMGLAAGASAPARAPAAAAGGAATAEGAATERPDRPGERLRRFLGRFGAPAAQPLPGG